MKIIKKINILKVCLITFIGLSAFPCGAQEAKIYTTFDKGEQNCIAISGDGRFAASGSVYGYCSIWDIKNKKLLMRLISKRDGEDYSRSTHINSVAISYDGWFAILGSTTGSVKIIDVKNKKMVTFDNHNGGHAREVTTVSMSSDGKYGISGSDDKSVKIWDIENLKLVKTFDKDNGGHSSEVKAVEISGNGDYAISGAKGARVIIWDIKNLRPLPIYNKKRSENLYDYLSTLFYTKLEVGHTKAVYTVAISRDGNYAISGSDDNTIKVWDIKNQEVSMTFDKYNGGHSEEVISVGISDDGSRAISGSWDNTVKVWDLLNKKLLITFDKNNGGHFEEVGTLFSVRPPNSVAISGNGKYAISSGKNDRTVKIWNLRDLKLIESFNEKNGGHENVVHSLGISEKGDYALSASFDGTIKVYKIEPEIESGFKNFAVFPAEDIIKIKYKSDVFNIEESKEKTQKRKLIEDKMKNDEELKNIVESVKKKIKIE